MPKTPCARALLSAAFIVFFLGCGQEAAVDLGPPEGWTSSQDGTRWWRSDLDTASVFPNYESLESMGVVGEDAVYATNMAAARQSGVAVQQMARSVKQELLPLYRQNPEVVDSLFEAFVAPRIEVTSGDDLAAQIERNKKEAYTRLRNHFRETVYASQPDPSQFVYPDSLRERGVKGRVTSQVYVSAEGEPLAIMIVDGLHPVLDAATLKLITQQSWKPAYLMRNGQWRAIPSWTRYTLPIGMSS